MDEQKIKESFKKVREDIDFFHREIQEIKRTLNLLKKPLEIPTHNTKIPTLSNKNTTIQHSKEGVKTQKKAFSIGNYGVPTLHPTNNPTLHPTFQHPFISSEKFALNKNHNQADKITKLQQVSKILESLDEIKKEIRHKFKKLTNNEMLIYSTIYQLEELGIEATYDILAEKLTLSEISIRDYVRKIIRKDVPLNKIKQEKNKVIISIPQELKKIASLNTIIQLREL